IVSLSLRSHRHVDLLRPHHVEQTLDDGHRGNPFSLSVKIGQNTMAQHRGSQHSDILDRGGKAPMDNGARLRTQDEILRGTRPSPPVDPFLDERWRFGMIWP